MTIYIQIREGKDSKAFSLKNVPLQEAYVLIKAFCEEIDNLSPGELTQKRYIR